jgi:hypothetical protein
MRRAIVTFCAKAPGRKFCQYETKKMSVYSDTLTFHKEFLYRLLTFSGCLLSRLICRLLCGLFR